MGICISKNTTNEIIESKSVTDVQTKQNLINKQHSFTPNTWKHLIVDDAKYNRIILKEYLNKFKIDSEEASDGKMAIEEVIAKDIDYYDIVWMDLRMPILDGFESTETLRKNGFKGIIIGVTGDVSKESVELCYDKGMNHVILKPIIFNELSNNYYIKKYTNEISKN